MPRWFTDDELAELSRPTMDRVVEAIDAGDLDRARALCDEMRHEWRFLHDAMAEMLLGLITFIQRRCGEDAVAEAWEASLEHGWRRDVGRILERERKEIVRALAATWRAHSTSGVGPKAGAFTISEDDEKVTFSMHPCGSGQRLWQLGKYEGENAYGVTERAHDWSFGRKDFPLYCTHCSFLNELLPIKWYGLPIYPSHPPEDFDHDPCVWHWYKDPADIPAGYWERYGPSPDRA
jgi:hypothetical protein